MYDKDFELKCHDACRVILQTCTCACACVCVGEMQHILQVLTTGECRWEAMSVHCAFFSNFLWV